MFGSYLDSDLQDVVTVISALPDAINESTPTFVDVLGNSLTLHGVTCVAPKDLTISAASDLVVFCAQDICPAAVQWMNNNVSALLRAKRVRYYKEGLLGLDANSFSSIKERHALEAAQEGIREWTAAQYPFPRRAEVQWISNSGAEDVVTVTFTQDTPDDDVAVRVKASENDVLGNVLRQRQEMESKYWNAQADFSEADMQYWRNRMSALIHKYHAQPLQVESTFASPEASDDDSTPEAAPLPYGTMTAEHGMHIHEHAMQPGDDGQQCGAHFDPMRSEQHGGQHSTHRHVGDMFNNIKVLASHLSRGGATARLDSLTTQTLSDITLFGTDRTRGRFNILNRALVIHSLPDDCGSDADRVKISRTTGGAGERLLFGNITLTHDGSSQTTGGSDDTSHSHHQDIEGSDDDM